MMKDLSNNILTVGTLPYLYQSHFHNIGFNTTGFYLDPNGNRYEYSWPETDLIIATDEGNNLTGSDDSLRKDESNSLKEGTDTISSTEFTIKPTELLASLRYCLATRSGLIFKLNEEIIRDIDDSPIVELDQFVMDAGWKTSYILVYNAELDVYKRILFASCGNTNKLNTSIFTHGLLKTLTP